jgi:DNA-directed RNA polymerase specialized sigma24 family protein
MPDLDHLLPAIAAGDDGAFARWVAGAEARVRQSLASFAAQVDVEAVLQEALLRAWQRAPGLVPDGRPDALVRWTVRTAYRLAVDEVRRRHGTVPAGDELAGILERLETDTPAEPDPLLRAHIHDCRDHLPGKPRAALDARLESGGGDPDATLAARLGMKLNTFLQNVTRAKKLLADCLERKGVELEVVR